jgi:hypothetical protein
MQCRFQCPILQFFELGEQFVVVGQDTHLVLFSPANDAILVHHKDRSLRPPDFVVEHAILGRDRAVRPKVGEERERNAAEGFAPGAI